MVSRLKSYPSFISLTGWWMLTEDPLWSARVSRVGVEDTAVIYSPVGERDFRQDVPGTFTMIQETSSLRLELSRRTTGRSRPGRRGCSWKRAQRDKKRCSYKAINCLRCSISLQGTPGRLASETTVKPLIDDLYVNAWKLCLLVQASPFTWDSIAIERVARVYAQ